jgi:hypothetical protein
VKKRKRERKREREKEGLPSIWTVDPINEGKRGISLGGT